MLLRFVLLLCFCAGTARAETPFWPDVSYNQNIPTLESVLGHKPGERITTPSEVLTYLDALVGAAPERTHLVQYATSWNGRPLVYMVVSNKGNMARLDEIKSTTRKLMDPRQHDSSERSELIKQTLPVSWMSYSVHGDEISGTDAALFALYHLLAAEDDPTVTQIMDNTIVVIDPNQNPDGRARFVAHFERNLGLEPAVHYLAAEHRQDWPRARTNHYLFDMNRDWFALTQPETRGRVKVFQEFFPVVHADVHEMGVDRTYYFPPPTPPFNPHLSGQQKRNLILYGEGNASAFDDFQFDYFTREIFDAHYAGYGDTWPAFHGAVAMTFEMASARGLVQRKETGELVTYRDGVQQHFVASMATMLTTAKHGERLLKDMADYREAALSQDQHYLFRGDKSLQDKLMQNLLAQGVEVHQLSDSTRVCGEARAKGDYVVKAGQPAGHLVRTLLDADSPIDPAFWQEKEQARELGLPVNLYDVLAWSVPALYGLEVDICQKDVSNVEQYEPQPRVERNWPEAKFGYLIRNTTSASTQFLAAALRGNVAVKSVGADFTIGSSAYKAGTLLIKSGKFTGAQHAALQGLANNMGVELVPLDSSWTTSGINFGSSQVATLRAPKIALAWDEPAGESAAGNARFVIERQLGYPTTTVRTPALKSREIDYFDVIILPSGGDYVSAIGEVGIGRLKDWVERGGVLITLGAATRFLISDSVNLLDSNLEASLEATDNKPTSGRAPASTIDSEAEYRAILAESAAVPDFNPGAIVVGKPEAHHDLTQGVADTLYMMAGGRDIYTPLKQGDGFNVIRYADESSLLHGGYLWEENRAQLAFKPAVMARDYGEGRVIGFVTDPTFRAYVDGMHVLLGNALFKSPSL